MRKISGGCDWVIVNLSTVGAEQSFRPKWRVMWAIRKKVNQITIIIIKKQPGNRYIWSVGKAVINFE